MIYLDIETYSDTPITHGTYRYAETAGILLIAWAVDDGPVQVCDIASGYDAEELYGLLPDTICAHNSNFDRNVLRTYTGMFNGCTWIDTMVMAYRHALPGSLGALCDVLGVPVDRAKDKDGKRLVHLFCKPSTRKGNKGQRNRPEDYSEEWKRFKEYARLDVEAMRECYERMPTWNNTEFEDRVWHLDQKINDRGYRVDLDLARSALAAVEVERQSNSAATRELTGGAVMAATQRDEMLKALRALGVDLPDLQAATVERTLADDTPLPPGARELLELRLEAATTSVSKYTTVLRAVGRDGRLRGTLQYGAASRTLRWGGRLFQPQNLPRPQYKSWEIEQGIDAIKAGTADLVWPSVTAMASSALRGLIVASEGKKLCIADLASIEGRVLAWLAGEDWKLDAYRELDAGGGYDMYVRTYAMTFSVAPEDVDKEQRQLGKVLELAMGYGGGVGAFVTFANGYGIDLGTVADKIDVLPAWALHEAHAWWAKIEKRPAMPEREFVACDAIKRMWRAANPATVALWRSVEQNARASCSGAGNTVESHYNTRKSGTWLRIGLPSGRSVCYPGIRIDEKGALRYLGVDQYTRKWSLLATHGGKLVENLTQAAARDVLAHGMLEADAAGFDILLTVHDEIVAESGEELTYRDLIKCMTKLPAWAVGLPLAAEGFETLRYRKD